VAVKFAIQLGCHQRKAEINLDPNDQFPLPLLKIGPID